MFTEEEEDPCTFSEVVLLRVERVTTYRPVKVSLYGPYMLKLRDDALMNQGLVVGL
jgi:hypothetical protein